MRKKIWLAVIALMLIATAVEAQFAGTVKLINGKNVQGYLWSQSGKLFVLNERDTLKFEREEISQVWRGAPVTDRKFKIKASLFVGEMSAIPSLPIGGITALNFSISKIINLGTFFHYGENEKTRQWDKPEKIISRTYGLNYDIANKEMVLIIGKSNNIYSDGRRKSQGNLFGVMKYSGKFFIEIGYLSRPSGIIGGFGVKL